MIIDKLEEKIRGKGTKIVFTEGWDPRVQQAAIELAKKMSCIRFCLAKR